MDTIENLDRKCLSINIHSFFLNKNKLNKNIEAEIARKIRTI